MNKSVVRGLTCIPCPPPAKALEQTYHVLHRGRAEYTLIHPPEGGEPPRVETKIIGTNAGETRLLLVGTGVWKMSRLLTEDVENAKTEEQKARLGCLITEV